jgi:hypothetical protein
LPDDQPTRVRTIASSISTQSRGSIASWNSVRPNLQHIVAQHSQRVAAIGVGPRHEPVDQREQVAAGTPAARARRTLTAGALDDPRRTAEGLGATSVRRRLSSIFHWGSAELAASSSAIQRSCQSPRATGGCAPRRLLAGNPRTLDVADESAPRVAAFEQVVAQDRVGRHSSAQRRLERVHLVHALAGERAAPEQILVDVRNVERVRIDAAVAENHSWNQLLDSRVGSVGVRAAAVIA